MKRIGILIGVLVLSAGMVFAQDNTSSSSTTTNTATSSDRDAAQDAQEQSQRDAHKAAASQDSDMAAQDKANAKDADTKEGENHDKVLARLDDSAKILNELLGAPAQLCVPVDCRGELQDGQAQQCVPAEHPDALLELPGVGAPLRDAHCDQP